MLQKLNRKILIINPNTNPAATQIIEAKLQSFIRPGTQVTCVNAENGPQGIDTYLDVAVSSVEAAKIVAANRNDYSAFILACGIDPGLDACRQIVTQPVIGVAEAAMLMACPLGHKFSIIATTKEEIPQFEELAARYGLTSRLASIRPIQMTTAELADREAMYKRIVEASQKAVVEDMAEVIVLTGSVMAGLHDEISNSIHVPVMVGLISALLLAEALLDYGCETSKANKYKPIVKMDKLLGYAEFQSVFSGEESSSAV
jgi:Asp/Glu/hydantoin racemase